MTTAVQDHAGAGPITSATGAFGLLYGLLSKRRKFQLIATFGLMMASGLAEVISIGAVFPFLALLADPAGAARHPVLAKLMVFTGLEADDDLMFAAVAALITLAIAAGAIRLALAWVSNKLVLRIGHDLGMALFTRVLTQSYAAHLSRNSSTVLAGVEKIHTTIFALFLPTMQGLSAFIIALFIIALLAMIDPVTMTIAALSIGSVYLIVIWLTRRLLIRKSEIAASAQTERIKQVQESVGGIRDIIIDRSQPIFIEAFRRLDDSYRNAQAVIVFVGAAPRFVIEAAGIVIIALIAMHMVQQPGGVMAAIPVLGALALGAQRLLPLFQQGFLAWSSYAGGRAALFDLVALIDAQSDTTAPLAPGRAVEPFQHDIELRDVSFRYVDEPVLRQVNLRIAKGERIGLIGETGSGKSTLLDILMGLLHPTEGQILVDGIALDDASRSNWQAQIAHVPQAIYLSDNSISENIAFGRPLTDIDEVRVREAAERAQIAKVIEAMPKGYATSVGERGIRLSGGQRQRLGIARALYKRSPVLVLDEATSALDTITEALVMEGISTVADRPTVLMVAHRLSTLSGCDRIVKLEQGAIAKIGTYAEMVGRTDPANGATH